MDETGIWSSYRNGNEHSFRQLYDRYYTGLFGYGFKFTADQHLIEESIQDLFVKLWRNRNTIGETPSVKFYLYKSFRRILIRKLEQIPEIVAYPEGEEILHFSFEIAQDEVLMNAERMAALKQQLETILATMTSRQREVIYLKYYEGLSHHEISEVLGITAKATYKLIYRALDHLRDHLAVLIFFLAIPREIIF